MIWALLAAGLLGWFLWRRGRWGRMESRLEGEMKQEEKEALRRDRRR
ncbi:hypothetical protein IIA16_04825 [bacterium]|nr:hypothetical protein [bacterium]